MLKRRSRVCTIISLKMSDEIGVRHIEKLDGANFLTWKFQLRQVFIAAGVSGIVDGTRTLADDATPAVTTAWNRDNAKAMVIISTTIERRQLESLVTCTSAKEMWDALCRVHEQKSASNRLFLTQKFCGYSMASGDSIIQHIARVKNMAEQLKDVGEMVSETQIMAKILSSLSPSYSAFQTVWDNVSVEVQTVDNLTERLLREEMRLGGVGEASEALAVTKNGGTKNDSAKNGGAKGKPRSKSAAKNRSSKKEVKCFQCEGKGHFARDCPSKKKNREKKDDSDDQVFAFVVASDDARRKRKARDKNTGPTVGQVRKLLDVDKKDVWLTDSGASRHISYRREWFVDFKPCNGRSVRLGDDDVCEATGEGTIYIEKLVGGKWIPGKIEGVWYVPRIKKNLFSVGVCTKKGCVIEFDDSTVTVKQKNKTMAYGTRQSNAIYRMFFRVVMPLTSEETSIASVDLKVWHERLGHVGARALVDMVKNNLVDGVKIKNASKFFCEPCQFGKSHRLPFKEIQDRRSTKPGEVIHTDVCGKIQIESLGGAYYYVTFIDEASSFCYVYFMRNKDEVLEKFSVRKNRGK